MTRQDINEIKAYLCFAIAAIISTRVEFGTWELVGTSLFGGLGLLNFLKGDKA